MKQTKIYDNLIIGDSMYNNENHDFNNNNINIDSNTNNIYNEYRDNNEVYIDDNNNNNNNDMFSKIMKYIPFILIIILIISIALVLFSNQKEKSTDVSINRSQMEMKVGETKKIETYEKDKYEISNPDVASIKEDGTIIGLKEGVTNLTITKEDEIEIVTIIVTEKEQEEQKENYEKTSEENKAIDSISFSEKEIKIIEGSNYTLSVVFDPTDATDKTLTWKSSNENVVVNSDGGIYGNKEGTAEITATTTNGKSATIKVNIVKNKVEIETIKLNNIEKQLYVGDELQLIATITPKDATDRSITWTSSDEKIATVDKSGKVVGVGIGSTTITATTSNGKTATCKITVKEKVVDVSNITLDKSLISIKVGQTYKLNATITPSNATNKKITWTSSNNNIATVDSNGNVLAKTGGKVNIIATSGNKTVLCVVNIENKIEFSWSNGYENTVAGGGASRVYSLPNGILVGGSEKNGKIYTVYSTNNGTNWSDPIIAASISKKECANINFFYDAGVLYMAYRATSGCNNSKSKCYTSLHVNTSYDNGKTWSYHSKIVEHTMNNKSANRGYWEPFLGKINDKLTVLYANDISSNNWQNIESLTWNGSSWNNKKVISNGKKHNSRDGMPAWIKLSDGTYVLLIESSKYRNNNHPFVIQMLYSKNGINWSTPKDIYIPSGKGSKAAAPGVVELSTGQIVISFQTDEDSKSKGDDKSVCKTIYSDGTKIESITKKSFSKAEKVFTGTNGIWSGINYYNGWLYVSGGSKFKRLKVG